MDITIGVFDFKIHSFPFTQQLRLLPEGFFDMIILLIFFKSNKNLINDLLFMELGKEKK